MGKGQVEVIQGVSDDGSAVSGVLAMYLMYLNRGCRRQVAERAPLHRKDIHTSTTDRRPSPSPTIAQPSSPSREIVHPSWPRRKSAVERGAVVRVPNRYTAAWGGSRSRGSSVRRTRVTRILSSLILLLARCSDCQSCQ
jgi:hypothetical protein